MRAATRTWKLALFAILVAWPWQATLAVDSLLAARPKAFQGMTLEAGKPRFCIPANCRLARNEHPRCLLTKEDIEVLRARLADGRLAAEFRAVQRQAGGAWGAESGGWQHALAWKLTGAPQYLDAIRRAPEFKRPSFLFGWAATLDLIWEDLSAEERRELSDLVAQAIARDGSLFWRPTLHLVSVFYEGGQGSNDAVFLARMKRDFDETLVQWTDKLNRWAAGRGGSDMAHAYNGEHAYWEPFVAAIAWSHATGQDYLGRADFAKYQSPFYWYHFLPEMNPLAVEKIGGPGHDFEVAGVQYGVAEPSPWTTPGRTSANRFRRTSNTTGSISKTPPISSSGRRTRVTVW